MYYIDKKTPFIDIKYNLNVKILKYAYFPTNI